MVPSQARRCRRWFGPFGRWFCWISGGDRRWAREDLERLPMSSPVWIVSIHHGFRWFNPESPTVADRKLVPGVVSCEAHRHFSDNVLPAYLYAWIWDRFEWKIEHLKVMGLENFEVCLAKCVISISHVFDALGEIRRQTCESKWCESPKKRIVCPVHFFSWQASRLRSPSLVYHLGTSFGKVNDPGTGGTIEVKKWWVLGYHWVVQLMGIDPFGHLTISMEACPIWSYDHLCKFIYRIP